MPARASYGPGWGPVALKDPRLKGWRPLNIAAPLGSTAVLLSAEEAVTGTGLDQAAVLQVCVRVTTPSGDVWDFERQLGRPVKAPVRDIAELNVYLANIIGEAPAEAFIDELEERAFETEKASLRASDGPILTAIQFLQALDAVRLWKALGLEKGEGREPVTVSKAELRAALDAAFLAGVRIEEAATVSKLQRVRTLRKARARAADSRLWWPVGATWAQALVDSWPSGQRVKVAPLAAKMWELWYSGPIEVARPTTPRTLEQDILPVWIAEGRLRLSSDTGEP